MDERPGRIEPIKRAPERRGAEVEENLETLSRWMDSQFRIPVLNWRFGLDSILGLVPGVGDTATSLASLYIMASAVRYGVPKITLLRMAFNVGLDYVFGSIPVIGDLFDAWWKSNRRNVELVRQRATVSPDELHAGKLSDWLFVGLITIFLLALLIGSVTLAIYLLSLIFR